MDTGTRILLLEDMALDAELIQRASQQSQARFEFRWVQNRDAFLEALDQFVPEVILSDYLLPDINGLEALRLAAQWDPRVPFIIVTGSINEETAVECMKAGATDYVLKERLGRLLPAVEHARQLRQFRQAKNHAEGALRESEARTRAILESALDAIITIDHQGRILEFNRAAEQTFGFPRADALGKPMADLVIPPALRERHRFGLARYLQTGQAVVLGQRLEMVAARKDGSEFPIELTITRVELEGPPTFTGFVRDITERKRAEADREKLIGELREAVANVKTLSGLLPICACCKKIRDDAGYWHQVETYLTRNSQLLFTHSYCPDCAQKLYPGIVEREDFDPPRPKNPKFE